jgi:hypothetical protein
MKHLLSRIICCCLTVSLLAGLTGIPAVGMTYSDITGHWAEKTLTKAVSDELLVGSDGLLRPDDPITGAELVAIVTRVFSAGAAGDLSAVTDIQKEDWYYDAASKAVAMGILSPAGGKLQLNEAIQRRRAFLILAEAFQLAGAGQDTTVLNRFTDSFQLTGSFRQATAALVEGDYIKGYGDKLHTYDNMTRAEFLTVLYSIVPNIQTQLAPASESGTAPSGGVVPDGGILLTSGALPAGEPRLSATRFPGTVYIDCPSSDVSLKDMRAETVVIRSDRIASLSHGNTKINRLVLAAGSGDISLYPDDFSKLPEIVVGTGQGRVVLGGSLENVEITGSNRTVVLNAFVKSLRISGSGNTVIIGRDYRVSDLTIYQTGKDNTVTLDGTVLSWSLYGANTAVIGTGTIRSLTDNAAGSSIQVAVDNKTVNADYGLNSVALALSVPETLPYGQALTASVTISGPSGGKVCQGAWYLDGAYVSGSDVTLGEQNGGTAADMTPVAVSIPLQLEIPRTADTPVTARLSFVLTYSGPDGVWHDLTAEKSFVVEPVPPPPPEPKFSAKEVLSTVTSGYEGDYTLAWAQENDYIPELKEEFVNLKDYSSKTEWLVWINITYQRVNVFSGSKGEWKLEKSFIVGTGAAGHDTPTGVFTILGRHTRGWTTKEYTVKPVINFLNSAYAFHSRLYYPKTTKIQDARIGFPVSHGCIRMYDEDVAWIYDNIPNGTTVVVW